MSGMAFPFQGGVVMTATRDLSALLGSRICHDLISPLGAIGNGVELLAMAGSGNSPEIALIAESVENANARDPTVPHRLRDASENQGFGASEIRNILADVYRKSRLTSPGRSRATARGPR